MKILLLTPQLPYPPQQGTSLRNYHILRGLAETHEVSLLSYQAEPTGPPPAQLTALCREVVVVPEPVRNQADRLWGILNSDRPDLARRLQGKPLAETLRELLAGNDFDIAQVEGLELAWVMPLLRVAAPLSKIVFDAHNAETLLQQRAGQADRRNPRRWPAAAYSWLQSERLARYEAWAMRAADAVTAVSEPDARALSALAPDLAHPVTVIPNSIDVTAYTDVKPKAGGPRFDVVFSGKMDYRPNVDAALWFADEVWPLLRAARPDATWAVVGQKPHARLAPLRNLPGVVVTGWVEDVRPYLAGAGVFVMPFRVGSGTRLKLIEALAAGLPLVSTPVGAEGFPVQHGREVLLAAKPEDFAAEVVGVLSDPALRAELGAAGRDFARSYDWRVVVPRFNVVYEKLVRTRRSSR